jgi:protein phosphatase
VGDVAEHKPVKRWPWVVAAIGVVLLIAAIVVALAMRG